MKAINFIFLLLLSSVVCFSQAPHRFIDNSIKVDNNNVPISSRQFYFPIALFHKVEMIWENEEGKITTITSKISETEIDTFHLKWYSSFLYAMKEPLLFNHQLNKTIFRFTWLRTFHNPIVIRLEKDTSGVNLFWKMTNGQGGYSPGDIVVDKNRKLASSEWAGFISVVDSADFWKMQRSGAYGTDGSEWILEGAMPSRYYVTSVWSPGNKSSFYKIGNFLLGLTDLKIKEDDKY